MVPRYTYRKPYTSKNLQMRLNVNSPVVTRLTGFLRPSGKITVGVVPPVDADLSDNYHLLSESNYFYKEHWDAEKGLVREISIAPPVGLSSVPNCREDSEGKTPRGQYGLRGISRKGKEAIQEGCVLLENRYTIRRLGFYTLTCPYTEPQAIVEFNRNISYIQKRYFEILKRAYERRGQYWFYVSVLEFQPSRWEKRGEAALHIHYVAPCYLDKTRSFVLSAHHLRVAWARACESGTGIPADTRAAVDSQVCKKSAAGYLSKYMSKGGDICMAIAEMDASQLPRQWWSMSSFLRSELKRLTIRIPQPICEYWYSGGGSDPDEILHLLYRKDIYVLIHGEERKRGLVGRLCRDGISAMHPGLDMNMSAYRSSVRSCKLYSRATVDIV